MAASGINEHHEARRKQNFINCQTYRNKLMQNECASGNSAMMEAVQEEMERKMGNTPGHLGPLSSYDLQKLHKQHGSVSTDMERRQALKKEQYLTYSAKINGRLSSTDYTQQW